MAMKNYGASHADLTINGLPIDEFGDSDPPITIEDIDARATLKRGSVKRPFAWMGRPGRSA